MGYTCQQLDGGGAYGGELHQGFAKLLSRRRWKRRGGGG
jgi:hypothetical protein